MEPVVSSGSPDRVRVLIATTQGPVDIEAILDLDPGEFSIVALGSTADVVTGLVAPYRNFVARGSGVIARQFGHDAFRLELSGRIEAGESWQLAVFIAHALHKQGRLAQAGEPAARLVWATGQVDYSLRVTEIGHLPKKCDSSLQRLEAERAGGTLVHAIWPEANGADADAVTRETLATLGIVIHEENQTNRIFAALGLPVVEAADGAKSLWQGSPYRGLAAFGENESAIFFGRGRAREEALDLLQTAATKGTAFLLIHGSSGAGKSSLARAGLLGDIVAGSRDADAWRSAVMPAVQPDRSPLRALTQALTAALPGLNEDPPSSEDALVARMRGTPAALVQRIVAILEGCGGDRRSKLVLLMDQFEDVLFWGRGSDGGVDPGQVSDRDAFAALIERLAKSGSVWIVATLRSDLLARLADDRTLSRLAAGERLYLLDRPNRAALREMVLGPARLAGLTFATQFETETPLSEVLVEAAERAPDCLPLLQFALARLYDLRDRRTNAIPAESYKRIGGLEGAIGRHAETCTTSFSNDPKSKQALEDVILAMARFDLGTGAVVARSVILDPEFETPVRGLVIEALVAARLVTIDRAAKDPVLRVAHQALLTHWPLAQQIVEGQRAALALREKIETEAKDWTTLRDPSDLLRGRILAAAQVLAEERKIDLSALSRQFVLASGEAVKTADAAEIQRLRRRGRLAAGVALLMSALVVLAGWFWLNLGRIELHDKVFKTAEACFEIDGYLDLRRNRVEITGRMSTVTQHGQSPDFYDSHGCAMIFAAPYTISGTLDNPVFTSDKSEIQTIIRDNPDMAPPEVNKPLR